MIYVPGLVTGQLSGKAGNTVARASRYATTIGVNRRLVGARTTLNAASRSSFATLAALYKTLTPTELASWVALGSTMITQGRLGRTFSLAGPAAFLSVNRVRAVQGESPLTTAPAHVVPAAAAFGAVTVTGPSPGPQVLSVDTSPSMVPADTTFVLYGQRVRSSSILAPPKRSWVIVATFAAGTSGPHNVLSAYKAACGDFVTGQLVPLKLIPYSLEGFKGPGDLLLAIAS